MSAWSKNWSITYWINSTPLDFAFLTLIYAKILSGLRYFPWIQVPGTPMCKWPLLRTWNQIRCISHSAVSVVFASSMQDTELLCIKFNFHIYFNEHFWDVILSIDWYLRSRFPTSLSYNELLTAQLMEKTGSRPMKRVQMWKGGPTLQKVNATHCASKIGNKSSQCTEV